VGVVPVTRRAVWKLEDLRRCVPLATRGAGQLGYVGWIADGNMGDEAMYTAQRRALPNARFAPLPTLRMMSALRRLLPHDLVQGVLLGGGTLIGWPLFRHPLERMCAEGSTPLFMLGTGVEDPGYRVRKPTHAQALRQEWGGDDDSVERELARWADLLSHADAVRVRGPRSAATLESFGISAEVTGDPALLLADDAPSSVPAEKVLGLNIGVADGVWGDRPEEIFAAVVDVGRAFSDRGWRIRFVPTWFGDVPTMRAAAREIGEAATVFEDFRELESLREALRTCRVFAGEKLHSIVLAATVATPALALAYHPKCQDFQESLDRQEYSVRTDRLDVSDLVDRLDELERGQEQHRAAIHGAVMFRRRRLEAAADEIGAALRC
jgi:polysaccharide pyruvyl transferase WcaK-like protein